MNELAGNVKNLEKHSHHGGPLNWDCIEWVRKFPDGLHEAV